MKNYIKKFIISVLWRFFPGKTEDQPALEEMNKNILHLLNIGRGADPIKSGEIALLKRLQLNINKETKNVVFDVGANTGEYSMLLLENMNPIELHVFEPHIVVYEKLARRLTGSNCVINNIGLSNTVCTKELFFDSDNSLLSSVYSRSLINSDFKLKNKISANFSTIDQYCEFNGIEEIFFLKLDVEGHELSVLEGARELMKRNKIKHIQFEFGGCNVDSRTFLKDFIFILSDYKIYRILQDGLFEIHNYTELEERFLTTNFFAELK